MTYLHRPARSRTLGRIAAMRRLTDILKNGEMLGDEIRIAMNISGSCCRKYIADLIDGAIVQMSRRAPPARFGYLGQPIYRLIATADQIEQFLKDAVTVVPKVEPDQVKATPGRRVHIMADDGPFTVKLNWAPVAPDPLALPVEFFKSVRAAGAVQCG